METRTTKDYNSIDISAEDSTTSQPAVREERKTSIFGEKGDTAAGFATGIFKGITESKLSAVLPIIAILGFIVIAFRGHMTTWDSFFIYVTFLVVTVFYFLLIVFVTEWEKDAEVLLASRIKIFLAGTITGVILTVLLLKYLFRIL